MILEGGAEKKFPFPRLHPDDIKLVMVSILTEGLDSSTGLIGPFCFC